MLPLLMLWAIGCLIHLLHDAGFHRGELFRLRSLRPEWPTMVAGWVVGALGMYVGLRLVDPDRLFILYRTRFGLWVAIVLLYPLISVYPQEIIWRAFFFRRYRGLFRSDAAMIAASGLAFSWVHIVMWNWLAVALCLIGGLLFGWRYVRSRSVLVTAIEHSVYGQLLFTIGLGSYFHATFGTLDRFVSR